MVKCFFCKRHIDYTKKIKIKKIFITTCKECFDIYKFMNNFIPIDKYLVYDIWNFVASGKKHCRLCVDFIERTQTCSKGFDTGLSSGRGHDSCITFARGCHYYIEK